MSYEGAGSAQAVGKRVRRSTPSRSTIAATSAPFPIHNTSTISIFDRISKRFFLIDSGADESVYPASTFERSLPRSTSLIAANNSKIPTFGQRRLEVSLAPGHSSFHQFWIADVTQPILGAPYFREHGLLIDLPNRRLVSQRQPGLQFSAVLSRSSGIQGLRLPTVAPYEKI